MIRIFDERYFALTIVLSFFCRLTFCEDTKSFGPTWSQLADIRTPPIVTSDFVYVRLIGDRSIQEKDFGHIQIDRIKEMKKLARNFRGDSNEGIKSSICHCDRK